MVLHGDEPRPTIRVRRVKHRSELPGRHRRSTKVKHFPRAHQIIQRLKRFLDRCLRIEPMDLVEIHVICSQAVADCHRSRA